MKRFLTILSLSLLPFLFGCDGGASYDTPGHARPAAHPAEPLVGTWRVRSYSTPSGGLQQCPSTTIAFSCTTNTVWTFHDTATLTGFAGGVRTFTYNDLTGELTFFGQPSSQNIKIVQVTDTLMQWDMNGIPGVPETVSLLFEKI
jgi:hypothetical protein